MIYHFQHFTKREDYAIERYEEMEKERQKLENQQNNRRPGLPRRR